MKIEPGDKMKKGWIAALLLGWIIAGPAFGQFTREELAGQDRWEEFLRTAAITGKEQMRGNTAVTSPWRLTLEKDGVVRDALWKNPSGKMGGYWEGWQYEIAAYLLNKSLGLDMVPPTVEREFRGDRGSAQLWIPDCMTLKERTEKKVRMPAAKVPGWNRATYLQRAWDNLIANEDRHQNQILITPDWRMILIDHSRSFRSTGKFVTELIFTRRHREGPKLMSELPRAFVEKIKALTYEGIRDMTGPYLTDAEIRAVLARRDLILAEIDDLIKRNGEDQVLY